MTAGLLALALAALADQPASAWVNSKFGIGLNWNWQSGGNNFLWGFFRNGQPPGPNCDPCCGPGGCGPGGFAPGGPGCMPPGMYPSGGHFPGFIPAGNIYGPQDFQFFGKQPNAQPNSPDATTQGPNNLYRTSSYSGYYPYYHYYYPANGNTYGNPYYSVGVNVGR